MQELINKIESWAEDRNLIKGSTPQKQFLKLMEEFGELCAGVNKNNSEMVIDSIGDIFIVLVILNKQLPKSLCLQNDYKNFEKETYTDIDIITDLTCTSETLGSLAFELIISPETAVQQIFHIHSDLHSLSRKLNFNLKDCISHAYNQIKDRKGKMINGVFVKEGDL